MPAQRARSPFFWLALALGLVGLTALALLACVGLGAVGLLSSSNLRQATRATAEASSVPESQSSELQSPLASANIDDADMIHMAWVYAMTAGDEAGAETIYAETDPDVRRGDVSKYVSLTSITLDLTEMQGANGRYTQRYETLSSYAGADPQHRTGLSRLLFEQGSLCFATSLVSRDEEWFVEDWAPADEGACDELAAPAPAAVAPSEEPPTTGAQQAHEAWVEAVLSGDIALAETLYAEDDQGARQALVGGYVALTKYTISSVETGAEGYGPFLQHELLGTYADSATQHVGLTRLVFEDGNLCFRTDLSASGAQWLVSSWNRVEPAECDALPVQGQASR